MHVPPPPPPKKFHSLEVTHFLVFNSQDKVLKKYKISEVKFGHIFCGGLPEFEISKKIMKMTVTSPKRESKSQNKVIKEKRQETIHKYFKSPGKREMASTKSLSPDKQKTADKDLMSQARPVKKQVNIPLGKHDSKKTLLSNKKDILSKKNLEFGKHENSGKKIPTLQQRQKSPKKSLLSGTSSNAQKPSPTKRAPKKFNLDSGVTAPQKQQLAKKVKDKYRDAGNTRKRDATKTLLEKHKMNKMIPLKQGMNDRFVLPYLCTLSLLNYSLVS
jgi:hypothetical protein